MKHLALLLAMMPMAASATTTTPPPTSPPSSTPQPQWLPPDHALRRGEIYVPKAAPPAIPPKK